MTLAVSNIVIANVNVGALGAGNIGIDFITGNNVLAVGVIIFASNAVRKPEEKQIRLDTDLS